MNFRYFILTMALIPSIAYTAEVAKKEDRTLKHQVSTSKHRGDLLEKKESSSKPLKKHPKKESAALPRELSVSKEIPTPVAEHILSLTQLITFNGTTQPFCTWLKNRKKNKFGLTRIVEADVANTTFIEKGNVNLMDGADEVKKMLAKQNAIYISNVEEKQFIQYGAIVLRDDLGVRENTPLRITVTTNFFLLWLIDQQSKELKKLKDEKKDKKKEELQDSKVEMLANAVEELKSSV